VAAISIALSNVNGIAIDGSANLYVPSCTQNRVYKVASSGTITTFAGTGILGYSGDGGLATSAQLSCPHSVAFFAGDLYITDAGNYRIRRVSGGVITTVAGTGNYGFSGDGGLAISAQISYAYGIAADSTGNLYFSDTGNCRIRKVSGGVITSVAGTSTCGYSGEGPATSAQLCNPLGIALDSGNNLYIADSCNYRIRKLSAGAITTVVGNGTFGSSGDGGPATTAQISYATGVTVDSAGNLYIADSNNNRIRKVAGGVISTIAGTGTYGYSGDGGVATNSQLAAPYGVAVDGAGTNLYIADAGNYRVRKVSGGLINTVAGNGTYQFSGDSGPSVSAQFNPGGIAVGSAGELYVADVRDYRTRKTAGGLINTVAGTGAFGYSGDGGLASNAQISTVSGVAEDGAGNLFIGDAGNCAIRKVSGGVITTVAGSCGYSGDGGLATNARLSGLQGIAADASGTLYLTDQTNNRIRKISGGIITMVVGGGPADGSTATNVSVPGQKTAVDTAGNVYVAAPGGNRIFKIATNGTISTVAGNGTSGYSGDGGAANTAQLNYPSSVAVDSATPANLYIADGNNCRIRKVSSGVISTIAGTGNCGFSGDGGPAASAQVGYANDLTLDIGGNLYIADSNNYRVRKISGGVITTVAGNGTFGYSGDGGPAVSAQISYVNGIAVDGSGNLYIADTGNYRVRKVSGGVIATVAGNGTYGYSGDGGPAVSAQINYANDVGVDSSGNLYIADSANNVIRRVSGGIITTFAGNRNICCDPGDGGLATNATLSGPTGVASDSTGNIYIADAGNNRIRKVSGGFINTIAGNGFSSFSGDSGQASTAQISSPSALAVDNSNNLYISDSGNNRVRMVSPGGIISTIAGGGTQGAGDGGPATSATLNYPRGIAVDGSHSVYVQEGSGLLRKVSAVGVISTVTTTTAGNGSFSFGGDGGVAVDSSNNVYLSDPGSGRVLLIVPAPVLQIAKTHNVNFTQGQNGDTYSVTVSNAVGAGPTNGLVTVTETMPVGLTLVSMSGTGWTCPPGGVSCTRSDVLAGGLSYPTITVTINVSPTAPAFVVNQVTVSGGGSADATVIDATTVIGCSITLNPPSATFLSTGGVGNVNVTAGSTCPWTAVGNGSWLTVTSQTNTPGNGIFNYTVAPNPNPIPRSDYISVGNAKFPVTQQAAVVAMRFVPVTPCRIADTRNAVGPFGGPALGSGSSRDFVVPSSSCGIPANALAYSLNLTVVPLGPLGYLSVWPAGLPQPGVSTLNSLDGRIKANAAIVPVGQNGAFSAIASDPTHLIVDINGYFVAANGSQDLAFYPITPCRLADTRGVTGVFGGPSLVAGVGRSFPVSGSCGIPASAQAYVFNMTVAPAGPLGFLTAWPTGSSQPGSSTLNAPTGTVTSNMAIIPAGNGGAISVLATNATDLIIDVSGYFAPPGVGSLDFYTATPCRILDTRNSIGPYGGPIMGAGESRSFNVPASGCGIPMTAKAFSLNATVVPPTPLGFLTLWGSGSQPGVSTLNSLDGTIVSNAAIVPAGTNGVVTAYTSNATHLILDISGYFQ
jgi:sugar lactone lactonase YvrE